MIRALIADDEVPARKKVRRELAAFHDVEIVAEAGDGREAVEAIRARAPDLVFLDIQMPVLDGFGVIDEIGPEAMPAVVFVTAYDQHAIKAFEVQALDYLLKPFASERFARVMARARAQLDKPRSPDVAAQLEQLAQAIDPKRYLRRVLVQERDRAWLLPLDEVERVQADRNYVRLFCGGREHLLRTTIAAFAARLDPARFLRISRSAIVRLDFVAELQPWSHGDYRVLLKDGTTLMWSRRFRAQSAGEFELGE